jgi:hypothetical protein
MAHGAAARQDLKKERTPRLDWAGLLRRTFALDVFAYARSPGCSLLRSGVASPG